MNAARRGPPPDRAAGFTLIELLMAIAILGMIATAVVGLILTSMRTTRETRERLNDTGVFMITSGYFGPDVQGANEVTANQQPGFPRGTAQPACGPDDQPLVVQLTGTDTTGIGAAHPTTVSYVLADGGRTMVRYSCSTPDADPDSEVTTAEHLDPARPPTITCRTAAGSPARCEIDSSGTVSLTLTTSQGTSESLVGARRTA